MSPAEITVKLAQLAEQARQLELERETLQIELDGLTAKRAKELIATASSIIYTGYPHTWRWELNTTTAFDNEIQALAGKGWYHYKVQLDDVYTLNVDDNTITISAEYPKGEHENFRRDAEVKFLKYLVSLGMPRDKITYDFRAEMRFIETKQAELLKATKFIVDVFTLALDNVAEVITESTCASPPVTPS